MPLSARSTASTAALCATLLLCGCGPQFFSAKGTVNSDGGALRAWSRTPLSCSQGWRHGDPDKIAIFRFDLPPGFDPSRPGSRNAPEELDFARSGNSVIGGLQVFAEVPQPREPNGVAETADHFILDASSCKTITLDHQEQSKGIDGERPIKGHLVLDCNIMGSHITSDMTFKQCTY